MVWQEQDLPRMIISADLWNNLLRSKRLPLRHIYPSAESELNHRNWVAVDAKLTQETFNSDQVILDALTDIMYEFTM
jgi:hypothetical protein